MDYKYIDQLLTRYWNGETTLEEEQILRSFFSQPDVPAEMAKYRSLFVYEQTETKTDVLGDDFDERILAMIGEQPAVRARVVTLRQRLTPLFKAAAIVAIILTLSNAAQVSLKPSDPVTVGTVDRLHHGANVAMGDSSRIDTLKQSSLGQSSLGDDVQQVLPTLK